MHGLAVQIDVEAFDLLFRVDAQALLPRREVDPHPLADVNWPGEQQDHAREHVGARVLPLRRGAREPPGLVVDLDGHLGQGSRVLPAVMRAEQKFKRVRQPDPDIRQGAAAIAAIRGREYRVRLLTLTFPSPGPDPGPELAPAQGVHLPRSDDPLPPVHPGDRKRYR